MKINLPFTYFAPPEARNGKDPKGAVTLSSIEVDLPVLAEAGAPVVAHWQEYNYSDERELIECRHCEGQFYVRIGAFKDNMVKTDVFTERDAVVAEYDSAAELGLFRLASLIAGDDRKSRFGTERAHFKMQTLRTHLFFDAIGTAAEEKKGKSFPLKGEAARRYPSEGSEAAHRKKAEAAAALLVSIGGALWMRVHEPKLDLNPMGDIELHLGNGLGTEDGLYGLDYGYFAGMGDIAEVWAEFARRGQGFDPDSVVLHPVVLMPEVFTFDAVASVRHRVMACMVQDYGKRVHSMDAQAVHAYLALRESVTQLGSGHDPAAINLAADTVLREFIEAVDNDDLLAGYELHLETFGAQLASITPHDAPTGPAYRA